ncbi:SRPBCC domain-containing protein [Rhodococcus fascians]|nr:SRPBCC domain-containing protein [Rhodococcus fascians]
MPFISSHKDAENLTMTVVAEFDATVERVWQIWSDPRQLERWWGPPTWPATFETHDFVPGGKASYFMTGPEGEKAAGWWLFTDISAPTTLSFDDGFADDSGNPSSTLPVTHATATLDDLDGRTRMTIRSRFDSLEQLEQLVEMGMEEGMASALGQIDAIVAD